MEYWSQNSIKNVANPISWNIYLAIRFFFLFYDCLIFLFLYFVVITGLINEVFLRTKHLWKLFVLKNIGTVGLLLYL